MRRYPKHTEINGDIYEYEKILKDDFFSVNVLYKNSNGRRFVLKLSDFRFIFGIFLRPFAAMMSSHEYKIYKMVKDLEGVPELGPRLGFRGYYHEYIEGKTLFEINDSSIIPDDFFDRLKKLIVEIHQRRIFYMDLDKKGNIILGDDGKPYLIDYQICFYFKKRPWFFGKISDKIFRTLIREDIYHLYKQKKRFQQHLMSEQELAMVKRSRVSRAYHKYFGNWYRFLKRKIYPEGSNEIIWYKWKKEREKGKKTS